MHNFKKKSFFLPIISALMVTSLFAGCGKEEEIIIPTVEEEKASAYTLTQAEKTDVVLSDKLTLKYTQKEHADYSFPVRGYYIKEITLKKGDEVKAGDLLAELDRPDLEEDVKLMKSTIEAIDVELAMLSEQKALEYDQADRMVKSGELKASDYEAYIAQIDEKYAKKSSEQENEKAYQSMRLDYYEKQLEDGRIYATMDGVVSFVRTFSGSQTSIEGQRVISLIDSAKCAFACEDTEFRDVLVEGQQYTISTYTGKTYDTVYHYFEEGDMLMFELLVPDYSITIGTKAEVKIEKEKAKDVVAVVRSAVHHAGELNYVYFIDENDIRHFEYVEVGLVGDTHVEIKSGVKAGDILVK